MNDVARKTPPRFRTFPAGSIPTVKDPSTEEQRRSWAVIPDRHDREFDLVVAGGGLSGVAAAIAATRRGLSAIIVEPTHMVGGQATAGGVSAFDITFPFDHAINDYGIWGEIVERTLAIYHDELKRPANVGHYRNGSLTPNVIVVERVLTEMLDDENVTVLRNTQITGAIREGGRVAGIVTTAGNVTGKVTIDATEDGQLLGLAGVPHRIGNIISDGASTRPTTPENVKIQDITFTAMIRRYPEGVPPALRMDAPPPGYAQYSGKLPTAFPREGEVDREKKKPGPFGFAGYRAAPDLSSANMHTGAVWQQVSRTSLNHFNDSPARGDYLTTPDARAKYEATSILRTFGIVYYLQNELGLDWGLATDEGFDAAPHDRHNPYLPAQYREMERHLPLIPYIRESRRLVGNVTLTGKMIYRDRMLGTSEWRADSIATGTYHTDLHGSKRVQDFESDLDESIDDKPPRETFGPFPIPMGTLIPESVDGLLAAEKNISASRLAAGAIRVHPTVTSIGEAAGVLTALVVHAGVQPRKVPTAAVQYELARGGALLTSVYVKDLEKDDPDFPAITLATTRMKVPAELYFSTVREQHLTVDREAAIESVQHSLAYLERNGFLID